VVDGILLYLSVRYLKAFCGLCSLTYLINLNCLLIALWGLLRSPSQILSLIGREWERVFFGKVPAEESLASYYQRVASVFLWVLLGIVGVSGLSLAHVYDAKQSKTNPERIRQVLQQYGGLAPVQIDIKGAPSLGPKEAPLTIVDFSDFRCPHCQHAASILKRLMREYEGKIRLVFKQFPNDSACNRNIPSDRPSSGSCLLAKAALCADAQHRFWEFHDLLFAGLERSFTSEELTSLAGQLGLFEKQFSACLQHPDTETRLRSEIEEGIRLGVQGTPVLFFNGKAIRGNPPIEVMRSLIEQEALRR